MSGLLPCPFCGGKAEEMVPLVGFLHWGVGCPICGAYVESTNSQKQACQKWNRRAATDPSKEPDGIKTPVCYVEARVDTEELRESVHLLLERISEINALAQAIGTMPIEAEAVTVSPSERLPQSLDCRRDND